VSRATAAEFRFSCPFPGHDNGDENASSYMNEETTAFFCHGCKASGNAVHFTQRVLGISPLEAIRMLKERYQPGYLNPDAVRMVDEVAKVLNAPEETVHPQPRLPEAAIDRFEIDWHAAYTGWICGTGHAATDYMFERGFDWQTLDAWWLGYDQITGRITIPIRNEVGDLIGFKARAWWDKAHPKYLVLGDKPNRPARFGWPCYFPSRVVFGAHRVEPESDLIICEGELNVLALDQKLGLDAVAINGSHFTEHHARAIRRIARSVTLFLDTDDAGEEAAATIVRHLSPFLPIKIVPPHEGDPAGMTSEQIAKCLVGAESALRLALR